MGNSPTSWQDAGQLSDQDLKDLTEIAQKLPTGHPAQKKISLLLSGQPTRFERERQSGADRGLWSGIKAGARNVAESVFGGGGASPGEAAARGVQTAAQTALDEQSRKERGRSLTYRIAAPAAQALVPGLDPRGMEEAAEYGDTGGVVGRAVVPAAMAAAPLVKEGASKGRMAVGRRLYDPYTGAMRPGVSATTRAVGSGLGMAAGYALTPETAPWHMRYAAGAGGGAVGGMLGPTLTERLFPNPNPPGMFSKMPMRMPKGGPAGGAVPAETAAPVPGGETVQGTRPRALIATPEEAASRDFMQGVAKRAASRRGMTFAGGMTPEEGRKVPRLPNRFTSTEYPGTRLEGTFEERMGKQGELPPGKPTPFEQPASPSYMPSEKAATLSQRTRSYGPEFEAAQRQEMIDRYRDIQRNPRATVDDLREAQARLRELGATGQ